MSNENTNASNDPLADLGLDLGGDDTVVVSQSTGSEGDAGGAVANTTATTETVAAGDTVVADAEKVKQTRVSVKLGEVEDEVLDFIPSIKRGGGGGKGESKYDFDTLAAPVKKEGDVAEGESEYKYAARTIFNVEGQEFVALQRSVQSAATAQNRAAKAAGEKTRFITRTKTKDGEAVGVIVFRVDDTIGSDE